MTDKMFRLMERYQRLDAALRNAQRKRISNPLEIAWLKGRKQRLRERLSTLFAYPATA